MRLHPSSSSVILAACLLSALPATSDALSSRAFSANEFSNNPSSDRSPSQTTSPRGAAQATADSSSDNSNSRPRIRKSPGAPLVDSSLLRYISKQKQSQYFADDLSNTLYQEQRRDIKKPKENPMDNPYLQDLTAAFETSSPPLVNDTTTTSTMTDEIKQQLLSQAASASTTETLGDDASSWRMRQFNHHAIAQRLIAIGADEEEAQLAGQTVQRYCLVRTARRRIRIFLKKRDNLWRSSGGASLASLEELSELSDDVDETSVGSSSSLPTMIADDEESDSTYGLNDTLAVMQEYGLTGKDISVILTHTPSLALMMPRASFMDQTADAAISTDDSGDTLEETLERTLNGILTQTLGLRRYDARKVLRTCPGLLSVRGSRNAEQIMIMMTKLGVTENSVARDKASIPTLLSRAPSGMFRLVSFLCSSAIRMPMNQVGPLLRRKISRELMDAVIPLPASSVNVVNSADLDSDVTGGDDPIAEAVLWRKTREERKGRIEEVYKNMTRTAFTLRDEIGAEDLGKVISAYPSVLLLDVDRQILPMAHYLMEELGIFEEDLASVLQLFPQLLGMDSSEMESVVGYLYSLGVEHDDLSSMVRAFPVLLTMKIEDMQPVVEYLRSIGVTDIGAFVTRLPPVLGYSVEKELKPKWEFLKTVCMFAEFEIKKFPAFFSYPLERVIKTRYDYLSEKGISRQLVPVDSVVRYGDNDFARKVARDDDEGKSFRAFCKSRNSKKPSSRGKNKNQKSTNKNQNQKNRRSSPKKDDDVGI